MIISEFYGLTLFSDNVQIVEMLHSVEFLFLFSVYRKILKIGTPKIIFISEID